MPPTPQARVPSRGDARERAAAAAGGSVEPFPETRWTLVMGAAGRPAGAVPGEAAGEALRLLAEQYRPAVGEWFRRAGAAPADAEDFSQEFVLDLLQGRVLGTFKRTDTRFRVFLQACLRNFLRDHFRRRTARKRGGGESLLELDESLVASPDGAPLERLDEAFALLVHRRALEGVESEWAEKGFVRRYRMLERFLFEPPGPGEYEAAARELAISMSVVKKSVFDLRQAYFQAVRGQILQTTAREDVAEELQYLVDLLSRVR